jgi:ribosomal-protein-alanine N-acetyltransferase
VRASGSNARRLYEKFGFVEDGRRRNYYSKPAEDAIVMSLGLAGATEQNSPIALLIGERL